MTTPLEKAIVRIINAARDSVGTGFVFTDDGLIATCAHIIESVGAEPGASVTIIFHATNETRQATVDPAWWRASDAEDVAILRLNGELPATVKPVPLGSSAGVANHTFETLGFARANATRRYSGERHSPGQNHAE